MSSEIKALPGMRLARGAGDGVWVGNASVLVESIRDGRASVVIDVPANATRRGFGQRRTTHGVVVRGTIAPGETVEIGRNVIVGVQSLRPSRCTLIISAPRDVEITRADRVIAVEQTAVC